MKAQRDIVILRRIDQREMSRGGIALVQSDEFTEDIGEIIACGPGKVSPKGVFIPIQVKEGDKILFSPNGHMITHFNGEELVVIREDSIMAVLDGFDLVDRPDIQVTEYREERLIN